MQFVEQKKLTATNFLIAITIIAYIIQTTIQSGSILMGLKYFRKDIDSLLKEMF